MKPITCLLICLTLVISACDSQTSNKPKDELTVVFSDSYFEDCARAEQFLASGDEIIFDEDTMCSKLNCLIPVVGGGNNQVLELINSEIIKVFCSPENENLPCNSSEHIHRDFMRMAREEGLNITINGALISNSKGYLALHFDTESYLFGAAHPLNAQTTINIDAMSGKTISLEECLKPGTIQKLTSIAENINKAQHSEGNEMNPSGDLSIPDGFEKDPFKLTNDFAFTKDGLSFYYDMYEISPASDGTVTLNIPYSELKDCINPESLAGKWVAGLK